MSNINKVILSGRLTRDPETRSTMSGTVVTTMSIAVNDRRRNQQTQEWEDYVNYIDCTVFGQRADFISRYAKKGMLLCVEGRLRWSSWERDGQKRSKIEVIVDEVELMSQFNQQGQSAAGEGYAQVAQSYAQPQTYVPAQTVPTYAPQPAQMPAQPAMPVQQVNPVPVTYAAPAPVVSAQPPADQVYDEDIPF